MSGRAAAGSNTGAAAEEETHFAWVEAWRRRAGGDRWELAMVVSTRQPAT